MDDEVTLAVHGGGIAVDQHQMFAMEVADETCRRLQEAVRASILGLNELAGTFDADGDADA